MEGVMHIPSLPGMKSVIGFLVVFLKIRLFTNGGYVGAMWAPGGH